MYFRFACLTLRLLAAIYRRQYALSAPEHDPLIRDVMDWEARYR